jgi:hypothetical protein
MKLWLDDVRPMPDGYDHWAKNAFEACRFLVQASLSRTEVTFMSFDHDLADTHYQNLTEFSPYGAHHSEWTGYDVAVWVAEHNFWPTLGCAVHSYNPVGARRICGVIDRYGPYSKKTIWEPAPMAGMTYTKEQCDQMVDAETLAALEEVLADDEQ